MSEILPEDLAIDILARLSMKDLSRFKCVCKKWNNLISHRQFAERYRDLSPAKFVSFHDNCFYLLDVESKNSVLTNFLKLDFPLDQSMINESTCVLHCDGMLCVTLKNHTLMVWNPSSNQFKILPNPGIYQDSNILGFGYDPVHDEYKLVTFIDRLDSSTAQVFEFRSDSWQESVRIPLPNWHYRERRSTFLDQYVYWIAYVSHVDRFVLCFNLSTHEYRKIPIPVYNQGITYSWLSVKSQQPCITEYEPYEKEIQISVMEKTGSWNKIITISMSNLISVQNRLDDYEIDFVSFTKKNDLFVTFTIYYDDNKTESEERTEKKMFLYKTATKIFEQVRFCNTLAGIRFLSEFVETPVIINRVFSLSSM